MTTIKITRARISCDGHAGNKVACAMLTALTVSLIKNLVERLQLNIDFSLKPGAFFVATDGINGEGKILIDAYKYSLYGLADSYPNSFSIVEG